jgi:hypothetical protein
MDKVDLDLLVDIAQQVEGQDEVEWSQLAVGKQESFRLVATSVLEMFDKQEYTFEDKVIIMSTITKLIVENMILNLKILKSQENS